MALFCVISPNSVGFMSHYYFTECDKNVAQESSLRQYMIYGDILRESALKRSIAPLENNNSSTRTVLRGHVRNS